VTNSFFSYLFMWAPPLPVLILPLLLRETDRPNPSSILAMVDLCLPPPVSLLRQARRLQGRRPQPQVQARCHCQATRPRPCCPRPCTRAGRGLGVSSRGSWRAAAPDPPICGILMSFPASDAAAGQPCPASAAS
jgi:hypothetical protein